jgi:hypothetical protein
MHKRTVGVIRRSPLPCPKHSILYFKLLVLIVLREAQVESSTLRPIHFHRLARLELFHTSTRLLVLAEKTAHQAISANLFLPARNHKAEDCALDVFEALLLSRDKLECAFDAERHGCVAAHGEHLFLDLVAGGAGWCLEAVCGLEDNNGGVGHACATVSSLCGAVFADSIRGAVKLDHVVCACGGRVGLEIASAMSAMVGQESDWRTTGFETSIVCGEQRVLVDVVWY